MTVTSLCIPKIKDSVSESYIKNMMHKSKIGKIVSYKEMRWVNDSTLKRILLSVEWDLTNPHYMVYKEILNKGKPINIVYDFPNTWKVFISGGGASLPHTPSRGNVVPGGTLFQGERCSPLPPSRGSEASMGERNRGSEAGHGGAQQGVLYKQQGVRGNNVPPGGGKGERSSP